MKISIAASMGTDLLADFDGFNSQMVSSSNNAILSNSNVYSQGNAYNLTSALDTSSVFTTGTK